MQHTLDEWDKRDRDRLRRGEYAEEEQQDRITFQHCFSCGNDVDLVEFELKIAPYKLAWFNYTVRCPMCWRLYIPWRNKAMWG